MTSTHKKVGYPPKSNATEDQTLANYAARGTENVLKILEGRWKLVIIFHLFASPVLRFSELEKVIPEVSQKMLTQQLRELESDGVVERTVYPQVPPRVEYALTTWGRALCPALDALLKWASMKEGSSDI
ncbi:winged helix-turn-helix transcriptional regulator [Undibacterium sp.]|uniref:winged helix-turn-helix transcriptional regulator n=1 Tax=Undibacterium sp. TaxID=1914977 RepID=UPI00374CFC8E